MISAQNLTFSKVRNFTASTHFRASTLDKISSFSQINYISAFSVLGHQNAEAASCTFVAVLDCIRNADQKIALTIAFTGETQYNKMSYGTDTGCFQLYSIKNIF